MRPAARIALGLAATAFTAFSGCRRPPTSPVILVSIDTLRPDRLGCYGHTRPTSPNLDAFRKDAVLFRNAIAHAPSTLASHASILTSLLPPHHGASISNSLAVPREVKTLAEVLRGLGYATASFNGGMQLDAVYGLDQGFETYESVKPRGAAAESLVDPSDRFSYVVGQARAYLSRRGEGTVFLFLHTYEVHHPYSPDASDIQPFRDGYEGPLPDLMTVALLREINDKKRPVDERDRRHIESLYDAEIRSMDRAFGDLVAVLKERGLYDPAVIVVTSDHGEEFGEHGRMGWHSHTLFEELLRVPLLVKLPGSARAGSTVEEVARGIDVAPTVLRALGASVPESFTGRDLFAEGPRAAEASETFSARDVKEPHEVVSIRTPEWKLIQSKLYDLVRDPAERHDVSEREAQVAHQLASRKGELKRSRPRPARRPAQADAELQERLRALGYLE